jgi:hypothetical protein
MCSRLLYCKDWLWRRAQFVFVFFLEETPVGRRKDATEVERGDAVTSSWISCPEKQNQDFLGICTT